jgi:ABC-type nitrate/sulfonate/bicarbonate transport system substrate-binding protein
VKINIALLALLLACGTKLWCAIAQTIKLNVAYPTTVASMAVLWVTKEARIFEKHGLEVELIYIGGTPRWSGPCWLRRFQLRKSQFPR